MEGLKLIAQSTFDRHQQFRPSAGAGPAGEGAYRYNVIEIGAFGQGTSSSSRNNNNNITATSASTAAARRQSSGSAQSSASGAARQKDGLSKISLNEWMVYEDDLCSFMKKRPIDLAPAVSGSGFGGELEKPSKSVAHSNTTHSTAPSKTASMPSSRMTVNTITTTATTTVASAGHAGSTADRPKKEPPRRTEEVEAVASLKLVCIPRADIDSAGNPDASLNTLAIARETFLRLYVDHMDADHCALYYLAREYDGYHDFTDTPRGVVTKFLGTSDFALIWTFNRRTLETRGLFLDRCQRWRSSDSGAAAAGAHATNNEGGGSSAPVTPVNKAFPQPVAADGGSSPATPTSKRWARRQTGTVAASEAWYGLRETLNTYRKYIFAPQVLSFVCCVQMLRSFDDQANGQDLPRLKEVEARIAAFEPQAEAAGGSERASRAGVDSMLLPTQSSSFAIVADPDPYGATTPPRDDEKLLIPTAALGTKHSTGLTPEKLISQSIAISRVDTSLADKLRHLKIARTILDVIARDTETLTIDVVAPSFLDRYHWAMEGMSEAIPALERHISSLDEYLRYLKGRAERLGALGLTASQILTLGPPVTIRMISAAATPPSPRVTSAKSEASVLARLPLLSSRPAPAAPSDMAVWRETATAAIRRWDGQPSVSLQSLALVTVGSILAIFSAVTIVIDSLRFNRGG